MAQLRNCFTAQTQLLSGTFDTNNRLGSRQDLIINSTVRQVSQVRGNCAAAFLTSSVFWPLRICDRCCKVSANCAAAEEQHDSYR